MTCIELCCCISSIVFFFVGITAGWQRWHNAFAALGGGMIGAFAGLVLVYVALVTTVGSVFLIAKIRGDEEFFKEINEVPNDEPIDTDADVKTG